jgi:hypothetical protein
MKVKRPAYMSDYELNLAIRFRRQALMRAAARLGRTHPLVLRLSQRLDRYLVEGTRRLTG